MKFFIKEFGAKFQSDQDQIRAYFKATEGKAKKLILERINPQYPMCFTSADEVLKALDASFHDFNKRANASLTVAVPRVCCCYNINLPTRFGHLR